MSMGSFLPERARAAARAKARVELDPSLPEPEPKPQPEPAPSEAYCTWSINRELSRSMSTNVARLLASVMVGICVLARSSLAQTPCVGDCDGNGSVAVNELVLGVNIALERELLSVCSGFDVDGDQRVMVNELVRAVDDAVFGCGVPTPTPNPEICG